MCATTTTTTTAGAAPGVGAGGGWALCRALIGPIERRTMAPRVPRPILGLHGAREAARQVELQFTGAGRSHGAFGYSRAGQGGEQKYPGQTSEF
jgi:hypothetical protein